MLPIGSFPEFQPHQCVAFDAGEIERRLVDAQGRAVRFEDADELEGLIEDGLKKGFTLPQGALDRPMFGEVETRTDDILDLPVRPDHGRIGPLNRPPVSILGLPVIEMPIADVGRAEVFEHGLGGIDFIFGNENVP